MPSPLNAVVIPVDVLDNGTELIVKASLPGVKPEDVSISILKGMLTIQATMNEDNELRGATYLQHERRADTFIRTLSLPIAVEPRMQMHVFKIGILTFTLRKSESVRPRIIKVLPDSPIDGF